MTKQLKAVLPKSSRGFFFATLVLIPFRLRLLLLARPVEAVWGDYTNFLLFASDISLLLLMGSWAAERFLQRRSLETGPAFLTLPLAGLTLAALLTSVTSIDPGLSLYHSLRLLLLFAFYLYVLNEVSSIRQLVVPLGLMLAIQAAVARRSVPVWPPHGWSDVFSGAPARSTGAGSARPGRPRRAIRGG